MTLDGETFAGELAGTDGKSFRFKTATGTKDVPANQLWLIRLAAAADPMEQPGRKLVLLENGGRLVADELILEGGKLTAAGEQLGKVSLDLALARTIFLPAKDQRPSGLAERFEALKLPKAAHDYLAAEDKKGQLIPYPGIIKGITAEKIVFEWDKSDRTIELENVRMVQLAPTPREAKPPAGQLSLSDGGVLPFSAIQFNGDAFSLGGDGISAELVKAGLAAELRFRSDRLAYLSELSPAKQTESGMFDTTFAWQRDRSSNGGPLRLGNATYARGLGMHSRCELVYDLGGQYVTFLSLAGIDDSAAGRGNATLRLIGDGNDLVQPIKLLGGKPAVPIKCSLAGVKQLNVLAEFGDDGTDIGDHVDLVEARLVKP